MKAMIINPQKVMLNLSLNLLKKLGVDFVTMSEEELEDLGLSKILK